MNGILLKLALESDGHVNTMSEFICSFYCNDFLTPVPLNFMESFNLRGLSDIVEDYESAWEILAQTRPWQLTLNEQKRHARKSNVFKLHGLIHQRYINTPEGLRQLHYKYSIGLFGRCPRYGCASEHMLPIGTHAEYRKQQVMSFCPKCLEVYEPGRNKAHLDGTFFGLDLPQKFFMEFPEDRAVAPVEGFVPTLYSFRIYQNSLWNTEN